MRTQETNEEVQSRDFIAVTDQQMLMRETCLIRLDSIALSHAELNHTVNGGDLKLVYLLGTKGCTP